MVEGISFTFEAVARRAGFVPGADGKLVLPNTQAVADALAQAVVEEIGGVWPPGLLRRTIIGTGAGPIWAWMKIGHALQEVALRFVYSAPNGEFVIFNHGLRS